MDSAEHVIIGAGLAGAATACRLTEAGADSVLVVEQEDAPGIHSSGRNAAMIRQLVSDPEIAALGREGAAFVRRIPPDWDEPVQFDANGSLLLGLGPAAESLRRDLAEARRAGLEAEWRAAEQCLAQVPVLEGAEFEGGVWCPTDGVVDVAALLQGYLREARKRGARLLTRCAVEGFDVRNRRVEGVRTSQGLIRCKTAINAAGAWAGEVARRAGAADLPLAPYRRHIFVSGPLDWVRRDWPFVWDVAHEVYFRPEPPGLLLSPCDEAIVPPGMPAEDSAAVELLGQKLERHLPRLADITISRSWAGLRTLASDHKFVIGWDRVVEGFLWVAALGGHGVTTSAAVGSLAARLLLGRRVEKNPFDPARYGS
ncbi:MAG: FAD-dependent oxidoreductase [Candidatus Sumerlaeota bacterium]|nr:FAD-dependent oxidoreductase [Candidatus Sumerlaeota bacterium]